jgi:hypothetical protein
MMFCHGTILGSVVVYIASIQMSLKLRILLMLKSMHLDLHLEIDNWGISKTKLYDKRDFFTFPIVNVPFMGSNIRAPQAHGVYISQLIRYSRACVQYRAQLLTKKVLKQGYVAPRLKSSLQKLYGRHHNLLYRIEIFTSMDIFSFLY